MADIDVCTDGVFFRGQERPECLDAGLFDEADHHGRGEGRGHIGNAGPARIDKRHGVARLDGHALGVFQAGDKFRAHSFPTLMLIGQVTWRRDPGLPQQSVRSWTNVVRMSSRPAPAAARTADHVKTYPSGSASVSRLSPTDSEARDRVLDPEGGNYFYFNYLWEVLNKANYLAVTKQDPSLPDDQVSIEDLVESMVVYGSPETVAEKLRALQERTGPFGTLLMAMMDGSGPNEARERESMKLLATEVAPRLEAQTATV